MGSFQLSYFQLYLLAAVLLECKVATQRPCKQLRQLSINYVQRDSMSISCLTTTHPLESLTVELRRFNPVRDVQIYPDISPASEDQRWSLRNDTGNVTLELKDIRVSDSGLYDCQVYKDLDCLNSTRFNLRVKECKILDSVQATEGSSWLLPCSEHPQENRTGQVTWKIITGHQSTDITQYRPPSTPLNSTEKPLYQRVRQLKNGSLLIRDVVNTDELWYQCRVNERTCYEVKLLMREAPTDNTPDQTDARTATLVLMATNLTVVVIATMTCVILCSKKPRSKINSQIDSTCLSSVYYTGVSGGIDVNLYSVDQNVNPEHLQSEQTEAM